VNFSLFTHPCVQLTPLLKVASEHARALVRTEAEKDRAWAEKREVDSQLEKAKANLVLAEQTAKEVADRHAQDLQASHDKHTDLDGQVNMAKEERDKLSQEFEQYKQVGFCWIDWYTLEPMLLTSTSFVLTQARSLLWSLFARFLGKRKQGVLSV
jgi:hypothetical protein